MYVNGSPPIIIGHFLLLDSPRNWKALHFICFIASFLGVFLLLISRGHYTIDVIVSYWISTRVFWQYHTMAGIAALRVSDGKKPDRRLF